jgi:hypothetical protein
MNEFDGAVAFVAGAAGPEEVFGAWDESAAGTERAAVALRRAAKVYRRLARVLHPDRSPAGREQDARDAFAKLAQLWEEYRGLAIGARAPGRAGTSLVTSLRAYRVGDPVSATAIANLYEVEYAVGANARAGLLKLPRDPRDNDLMEREAAALAALRRNGDPRCRAFAPELIDAFRHRDPADGVRRQGVITAGTLTGFHTLAQVRDAYPGGVDPRDAAWMWRRLLVALDYAHDAGIVHGAVLPATVYIHAELHGLVLTDWCFSVHARNEPIPAIHEEYRAWYPPEVAARRAPSSATDIYLATRCMAHLIGKDAMPRALTNFVRGCTLTAESMRPRSARRLLGELDDILERLYGRRTFRPFAMPSSAPANTNANTNTPR